MKALTASTPGRAPRRAVTQGAPRGGALLRGNRPASSCVCGGGCPRCREKIPVRAKLAVGEPGDAFEREADAVAEAALRSTDSDDRFEPVTRQAPRQAMRAPARAQAGRAPHPPELPTLGSGRPLPATERTFFESRMGHDLGDVRIHTGDRPAAAARSLAARAFTVGGDVVFGEGEYAPHSHAGRRLLAHELAHTIQQREHPEARRVQRTITVDNPGDVTAPNTQKNGALVVSLFNTLCRDVFFQLNGDVVEPVTDKDCDATALKAGTTPTACTCACNFTKKAGPHVSIEINPTDNNTISSGANSFHTKLTGLGDTNIRGIRGNAPASGTPLGKVPDPAWLILGHELCGHANTTLPNMPTAKATELHQMSQNWSQTAVDVENRIRQERDAASGTDLGMRIGEFEDLNENVVAGSLITLPRDMSLALLFQELGVPVGSTFLKEAAKDYFVACTAIPATEAAMKAFPILDRVVATSPGDQAVPFACLNKNFPKGSNFNIEGVFWHRSIAGQTKQDIAAKWGVSVAAMNRANAVFGNGVDSIAATQALTAGTMVCIPYKSAPGTQRYFMTPSTASP